MAVEVRAQITGTVWKVLVQVGQRVVEEETVVILESMKMEIPVEATADGSVLAVHVSEGDSIEDGALIVTLE
ncbi:MAG: biotin/lipoyl-binding carrier protein [Myxococcales bacterium]|nr:biotin/lipoyl-binding carrier protein [Myxococcales bacterium]